MKRVELSHTGDARSAVLVTARADHFGTVELTLDLQPASHAARRFSVLLAPHEAVDLAAALLAVHGDLRAGGVV